MTVRNRRIKEFCLAVLLQILTGFQTLASKLLPQNTERRKIYNFAIFSARTLKYEGFEIFIHQLRNLTIERYVKSSKIPIIETKVTQKHSALSLTKTLQGELNYPTENLYKINIFTAIQQKKNSEITLQIIDENKIIIREITVKSSDIKDNGYTSFTFEPIKGSKDKILYFKLKSIGKPSALIEYENIQDLKEITLFYDNENLSGHIGFQAFSDLGIKREYDLWVSINKLTEEKIKKYKREAQNFTYKPKISIIMPVYNVDEIWLEKAIDSVRNQLYPDWELCIADDASTRPHIKSTIDRYKKIDPRIKVKYLRSNLGISGASNEAVSLATSEFIGLLDNDDELSIDALHEIVKLLNKKPETDVVYSDEDKIDTEGHRCTPFFKPDWSPDLLLEVNYICHFTVIRKKILEEVGKFRSGFEGSQDYDLFLRIMEKTDKIEHIPKVLYHWRMIPGSTASNINAKDKVHINGIKTLQDHLNRQKIEGTVYNGLNRTSYRINYTIKGDPLVSIIVHFNDNTQYLKRCINSILRNEGESRYEILLLMSDRNQKSPVLNLDPAKKQPDIKTITYDSSFNLSEINNFAVERANGDYLLFLSSKIEITTDNWLSYLLMNAQRKGIGCVGPKILTLDGTIKHAGIIFGRNGAICNVFSGLSENNWTYFGLDTWSRNYLAVSGECLMINKDRFLQAGGFDKNLKNYANYIDLCLRIYKKGYRNLCIAAVCVNYTGICSRDESIPHDDLQEILRLYDETCSGSGDPYYNPNLNLEEKLCKLNIPYQN